MASLRKEQQTYLVLPEGEEERALLAHATARGALILDGANYRVASGLLELPRGVSEAGAWRVCRAFERAARRHQLAEQRRAAFRLVDAPDEG